MVKTKREIELTRGDISVLSAVSGIQVAAPDLHDREL